MYPQNTLYDVREVLFRFSEAPVIGTPYYFPPDKYVDKNILRAVQCVTPATEVPATLPLGAGTSLTTLKASQLKNTFITLVFVKSNGEPDEFIKRMPLYNLIRANNSSRIPEFRRRININKCYLEFSDTDPDGDSPISTNSFILFYMHLEAITQKK